MRERHPQQLNPYIYDRMLYKRQMKSNPDAIVKFVSPRHRGHSGGAAKNDADRDVEQAETQGWAMEMDINDEEDESWVESHRWRSKNRDANALADDAGDTSMYPELESSDEDQSDMKKLQKEAKRAKERALRREREETKEMARREKAESAEKEVRKTRRSKPFPMRGGQGKERAKRVGEPDKGLSTDDRGSRSSVGEC